MEEICSSTRRFEGEKLTEPEGGIPVPLTLSFGFQVRPQSPRGVRSPAAMASPAVSPDSSSHEALSSVNSAPACSPTSDSENLSPDELELLAKLEEQNR